MKKLLIRSGNTGIPASLGILEGSVFQPLELDLGRQLNIYTGRVVSIEGQQVEVDIGSEQYAKLQLQDKEDFKVGDLLLVQVVEDGKNPVLTRNITISGNHLSMSFDNDKDVKFQDLDLVSLSKEINLSGSTALSSNVIVQSVHKENPADIEFDLKALLNLCQAIIQTSKQQKEPALIFQEIDPVQSSVKKAISEGVTEVYVDCKNLYQAVKHTLNLAQYDANVNLYKGSLDIIECHSQIEWQDLKSKSGLMTFIKSLFR